MGRDEADELTLFVLRVADDDWVSLAEFVQLVEEKLPTDFSDPSNVRERALALLAGMLRSDLLEVGELAPHFRRWKETPDEAIERVRHIEWPTPEAALSPFGGCWFQITSEGERIFRDCSDQLAPEVGST